MECEIDRRTGAVSAVMQKLYWAVVLKGELNLKAKLSAYKSIYSPALSCGHEL